VELFVDFIFCTLQGDYIKDKMGGMEEMRNAPLAGQPDGKTPAGIPRRKKEDNIKVDLE
jgi:hypothetical protein